MSKFILSRAEMLALWRCIEDSALMNRQMLGIPSISTAQIEAERQRVSTARKGYLKLSKARKAPTNEHKEQ